MGVAENPRKSANSPPGRKKSDIPKGPNAPRKNAKLSRPPKGAGSDKGDENEVSIANSEAAAQVEDARTPALEQAPLGDQEQDVQQKVESETKVSPGTGGAAAAAAGTRPIKSPDAKKAAAAGRANLPKATPPKKPRSALKAGGTKVTVINDAGGSPGRQQEQQQQQIADEGQAQQQQQQQLKHVNANALQLLKLAKASHIAGDNPMKAIDYASRAATSFEREDGEAANLELVLCLHIVAAGYCRLKRYNEAIEVLESSLLIPNLEQGSEHALAVFAGHMQLGDTLSLEGRYDSALASYHTALNVQKQVLGDMDPRVAETGRYLSEAHLQAMQFEEAQQLCEYVLDIHSKHSPAGSIDEAVDRKLMALIHSGKGEYEMALEHLVLASTTLSCNGQEMDVALVDCSIGEAYFALGRYDEAVFSYQKALTILKAAKGDSHASVASIYVSLADLYLKTGKQREAKTYCENALKILGKHNAGHAPDDLSSSLVEIAGVFEAMGEREQALSLLRRSLDILLAAPGEQSAAAGVEAQIGVLLYVMGKYSEAYEAFKNAISKLKQGSDKQTAFLGILYHQMGLASVELRDISTAAEHLEEAKRILTDVIGPHHADTLAVCSNLAGCYDALGRLDDAISLLENVVQVREESLGTVHPDVVRDRERLVSLLKCIGRSRARKTSTLEELLLLPNARIAIS